jgi:hypothetical protein
MRLFVVALFKSEWALAGREGLGFEEEEAAGGGYIDPLL